MGAPSTLTTGTLVTRPLCMISTTSERGAKGETVTAAGSTSDSRGVSGSATAAAWSETTPVNRPSSSTAKTLKTVWPECRVRNCSSTEPTLAEPRKAAMRGSMRLPAVPSGNPRSLRSSAASRAGNPANSSFRLPVASPRSMTPASDGGSCTTSRPAAVGSATSRIASAFPVPSARNAFTNVRGCIAASSSAASASAAESR